MEFTLCNILILIAALYFSVSVLLLCMLAGCMAAHRENIRNFIGCSWKKTVIYSLIFSLFWGFEVVFFTASRRKK